MLLLGSKAGGVAADIEVELFGELGFEEVMVDAVAKLAAELAEGGGVHCLWSCGMALTDAGGWF